MQSKEQRKILFWVGAGLLGLVLVATVTAATSTLALQKIGLSSEPEPTAGSLTPASTGKTADRSAQNTGSQNNKKRVQSRKSSQSTKPTDTTARPTQTSRPTPAVRSNRRTYRNYSSQSQTAPPSGSRSSPASEKERLEDDPEDSDETFEPHHDGPDGDSDD